RTPRVRDSGWASVQRKGRSYRRDTLDLETQFHTVRQLVATLPEPADKLQRGVHADPATFSSPTRLLYVVLTPHARWHEGCLSFWMESHTGSGAESPGVGYDSIERKMENKPYREVQP